MSLPVFQSTIVTSVGDIIPSPVITVLVEATGDEASLFSDRNGSTVLGTDGVFSGTVDGFAQFYAAPAEYRVTASDAGSGFSKTWRYVVLSGTAATSNIQTSATDTTAGALMAVGAFGTGVSQGSAVFSGLSINPNTLVDQGVVLGQFTLGSFGTLSGWVSTTPSSNSTSTDQIFSIKDQNRQLRRSLASGAWGAWVEFYTGANLNPNVFGGDTTNDIIASGYAESTTLAIFVLPLVSTSAPTSITSVGTLSVKDSGTTLVASGKLVSLSTTSQPKLCEKKLRTQYVNNAA